MQICKQGTVNQYRRTDESWEVELSKREHAAVLLFVSTWILLTRITCYCITRVEHQLGWPWIPPPHFTTPQNSLEVPSRRAAPFYWLLYVTLVCLCPSYRRRGYHIELHGYAKPVLIVCFFWVCNTLICGLTMNNPQCMSSRCNSRAGSTFW